MIEQIGKYRILGQIGRGGMGTVFRAQDTVLGREIALKVISTEGASEESRARFFREAQACARLSHPNIITLYDLGEEGGRLFIVMELLAGEELRRLIERREGLSLAGKCALMAQVCDGLHYAHRNGIVHRDVKPANIFVLPSGQVKVLDFGLARIGAGDSGLTRTGLIMGTLRYMAPEQARGRADHRTDIFSVGAVLYELLSYQRAFDSDDPIELLDMVRSFDPPSLTTVDPTIPVELAGLVERALRKDPAARFTDLGELRAALGGLQQRLVQAGEDVTLIGGAPGVSEQRVGVRDGESDRVVGPSAVPGSQSDRLARTPVPPAVSAPPAERPSPGPEAPRVTLAQPELPAGTASSGGETAGSVAGSPRRRTIGVAGTVAARVLSFRVAVSVSVAVAAGAMFYVVYPGGTSRPTSTVTRSPAEAPKGSAGSEVTATARPSVAGGPGRVDGEAERQRQAALEGASLERAKAEELARLRTGADGARLVTVKMREEAQKTEAGTLAKAAFDQARVKEGEGDALVGRQQFAEATAAYQEATRHYGAALRVALEARAVAVETERQRVGALEKQRVDEAARLRAGVDGARQAMAQAREQAQKADAGSLAKGMFDQARVKEGEGDALVGRQQVAQATAAYQEATRHYGAALRAALEARLVAAETERQRVAALEKQRADEAARLRAGVDGARQAMAQAREQAQKADAGSLAKGMFDQARVKEGEGDALVGRQQVAQATTVYQDAAKLYGDASRQAEPLRVERSSAEQARTEMLAAKQKARPGLPDFQAALTEESKGVDTFGRLAFKEASGHFRAAQALFAKAATQDPPRPGAATGPPAEIRQLLALYKQAIEAKDLELFKRVRPNLGATELRSIRQSFDQSQSQRVELVITSVDVTGDESIVKGRRIDAFVLKGGREVRNETDVLFRLKKTPTGWVIDAIN